VRIRRKPNRRKSDDLGFLRKKGGKSLRIGGRSKKGKKRGSTWAGEKKSPYTVRFSYKSVENLPPMSGYPYLSEERT